MDRDAWMQPPEYIPTMPVVLHRSVSLFDAQPFIINGDDVITFAGAERRSARLAEMLLRQGVGKGTRVGLLLPNTPDWVVAFLAVTRIGAFAVLISTLYQKRDLAWALRHGDIDTLLMVDRYLRHDYVARIEEIAADLSNQCSDMPLHLKELPYLRRIYVWGDAPSWALKPQPRQELDPSIVPAIEESVTPADLCLMIYTSGSTAEPKGIVHAHGPLVRRVHMVRGRTMLKNGARVLQLGPFCWIGGVISILQAMQLGICIICPSDTKIETIVPAIKQHRPTHIYAQPAMIKQLAALPDFNDDPSIADFLQGERDARGAVITSFSRGLGMTETVAMHSMELWGEIPVNKPGAFGRGVPDFERQIRDIETGAVLGPNEKGELWVRSPNMMLGMYKRERRDVFDADGFYNTGDLCSIDEDGYLFFGGRSGEMIKTKGANVSPREVELLIESFPGVEEAGVFALPGDNFDQIVACVVIPRSGAQVELQALRHWLFGEISAFKVPKSFYLASHTDVPRTRSGKLDKRALANRLKSSDTNVKHGESFGRV